MQNIDGSNAPWPRVGSRILDSKGIVMGLHWDRAEDGANADCADLDALCVLFDHQHRVLRVIHPGAPRRIDDSVLHTGDSRTGASAWDDERIFVFLEILPQTVVALTFMVVSPAGRAFSDVRGAVCHISDRVSEDELFQLKLTDLEGCTACNVATLRRTAAGWHFAIDAHPVDPAVLAELAQHAATSGTEAGVSRLP